MIDQEIYFKGKDIVIASNIHRIFPKELLLHYQLKKPKDLTRIHYKDDEGYNLARLKKSKSLFSMLCKGSPR